MKKKKFNVETKKASGPYIIDRTTVKVGEKIELTSYSGNHFEDGNFLKVIGFGVGDDNIEESFLLRGVYFAPGEYECVTYQVAIYCIATGQQIDVHTIYPEETEQCERMVWLGGEKGQRIQARMIKKAILSLRAGGLINEARMLEGQRKVFFEHVSRKRRKELALRLARDLKIAAKTVARMSKGKHVRVIMDDNSVIEGTLVSEGNQEHSEGQFVIKASNGHHNPLWREVAQMQVLGEGAA
jgi:hypothetical protein